MRYTFKKFLEDQRAKQPPALSIDLAGKTVVVLGANTGLGFEATRHFATMNPGRLILACRSRSKGEAAVEKLKTATGYNKSELWLIDLADFESVKQFADKFEKDGGRLDILVENAATIPKKYEATKDGWETALQVNCLSTPLLAILLLPLMIRTAEEFSTLPRIVVVGSSVHYWSTIEENVRNNPGILRALGGSQYCTQKAIDARYYLTKLLTIFFVRAFNARISPSTPVIVNTVNPGYCHSELRRTFSGFQAVVDHLTELALAFTTEEGSRQLVWGAIGEQENPETLRGAYISGCKVEEVSDFVLSPEGVKAQNDIWDEMLVLLGNVEPRVTTIAQKYL
ncbi:hypothetical protein B0H17DRAFT_1031140 [Mycena rosella]|uniref:NAD(P)-binding protein n=1 Tax=Mycena rosella TaxID=1033263 RepID=A0AAD7GZX1_MYCRO|nr:hypothetical protein B0H17DRAFT_1031140 [Mycena rosella]